MTREEATGIPYNWSRQALVEPGGIDNFFQLHRPRTRDAVCAEMARLAYGDFGSVLRPALARAGFDLAAEPFDRTGTQAFLAAGPDYAVLAFRGSDDVRAWAVNLSVRPVAWVGRGRVHEGFAGALQAVWPKIETAVRALDLPLLITGHSQGGALAALAAARLSGVRLVTFGCPKVGDAAFCASVGPATRYVNNMDVVCRLPLGVLPMLDVYAHVGDLRFIDASGDVGEPNDRRGYSGFDVSLETVQRALAGLGRDRLPRSFADHSPINYVSAIR